MAYFDCIVGGNGKGNTVIVTCDEDFAGATITMSKTGKTYSKTCPSTAPYTIEFAGVENGTYTISGTVSGKTYTSSVVVQNISAVLNAGFNWGNWVTAGGLDPTDYSDLDDVFDDEAAVRRLMTVHASADYLIEKVSEDVDEIDVFCADDTAMKWIGLRDYVCDGLTAIDGVWAKFMASDYWERILKDHVPTMTSNTAPYGTVSASSAASANPAYYAFNDDLSNAWVTNASVTSSNIYYAFTSPTAVRKAAVRNAKASGSTTFTYKVQYSDVGTTGTWTDIPETATVIPNSTTSYIDVPFVGYHRYWRIAITSSASITHTSSLIQFYGRSLNVSVPIMTSNTAPYGEVISKDAVSASYPIWKVFDGDDTTYAQRLETSLEHSIGYCFTQKVCVKAFVFLVNYNSGDICTLQVSWSDDGVTYTDIGTPKTFQATSSSVAQIYDLENNTQAHKYWMITSTTTSTKTTIAYTVQFYGVDYSEKEFEAGTTRKWLYDHGVELETIQTVTTDTNCIVTKNEDNIYLELPAQTHKNAIAYAEVDLSNYSLFRGITGDNLYSSSTSAPRNGGGIAVYPINDFTFANVEGYASSADLVDPYTWWTIDISSFNEIKAICVYSVNTSPAYVRKNSCKELWLE